MQQQQDTIGLVGLGISAVGAIASIITNNVALASIPLTVGVGCNVISRKQSNTALIATQNAQQQTIEQLSEKLQQLQMQCQETIPEQLIENKRELANLLEETKISISKNLSKEKEEVLLEIQRIDAQHQNLTKLVQTIEEVENTSQNVSIEDDTAIFYYDRGVGYEQLGNKEEALKDYTEAIKQDSHLAKAFHKRGIIYLEQGQKQRAVDDLRKASLLYFEQGDIDSYHQAREMSRNVHDLKTLGNGKGTPEMIAGNNLFS